MSHLGFALVSPRAFLPVQLVEGRIAKDLCTNLIAIRDYVTNMPKKGGSAGASSGRNVLTS